MLWDSKDMSSQTKQISNFSMFRPEPVPLQLAACWRRLQCFFFFLEIHVLLGQWDMMLQVLGRDTHRF